jgi:hypothetical protein
MMPTIRSHVAEYAFARLWVDTPHSIVTDLPPGELTCRLERRRRHEDDGLVVLIRPRSGWGRGYALLGLRRGRLNALRRFFYAEVVGTENGSTLQGVIRTRRLFRWFVTLALSVFVLILVVVLVLSVVALVVGDGRTAMEEIQHAGVVAFLAAGYLGITQMAMAASVEEEALLLSWLADYLS